MARFLDRVTGDSGEGRLDVFVAVRGLGDLDSSLPAALREPPVLRVVLSVVLG